MPEATPQATIHDPLHLATCAADWLLDGDPVCRWADLEIWGEGSMLRVELRIRCLLPAEGIAYFADRYAGAPA